MKRLRICLLITELGPAGAERCVYELARRLDRTRFDVQVAALRGGQVAGWLNEADIPTTILNVRHKLDFLKLRKLVNLLRRERINLLHTHLFHADLAGRLAAASAGVPHLVHTVHVAEGRFRPWQFAWARMTADRCDRIICVSESVRECHARHSGLPLWRYTVIPNGIDVAAFSRDVDARDRLRGAWNIADDETLLAFVGRLDYQKGVSTLLGAMSHLGARGDTRRIIIAGDGPQRDLVENFIAHGEGGNHCRYLGFTREVRDVLSAADIFVMPSRWEGLPLGAVEAMAAGLPIIGTNVPGLRNVVQDGRTGILIKRDDSVGLAEAIELLANDPSRCESLGNAGRAFVAEHFDIPENIAAHERLYLDVAGRD